VTQSYVSAEPLPLPYKPEVWEGQQKQSTN